MLWAYSKYEHIEGGAERVRKQLSCIEHLIQEAEVKLADQGMDATTVGDFQIQIFEDPRLLN